MERSALEEKYGQVWTTEEFVAEFEATSFFAPFVFANRRSDGRKVTLQFQHSPRFYFWAQESS